MQTLEDVKMHAMRGLQDANMMLCDVYFLLDEHTSPAFNEQMSEVQEQIREIMSSVERLERS